MEYEQKKSDDINSNEVYNTATRRQGPGSCGVAKTLIRLLSEQRELYVRLAAYSDSQRSMITGDQPQRLLAVLADRQKLFDRLEHLAEQMRPYR